MNLIRKSQINMIIMWLSSICSLILFVLDLFVINVWKELAVCFIIVGLVTWTYYLFQKTKNSTKIISSLIVALLLVISITGTLFSPIWNSYYFKEKTEALGVEESISKNQAIEDLEFLMQVVNQTHPMFIKGVPSEFQNTYDNVYKELELYESINIASYFQKIQSVMSTLNDAHTVAYGDYYDRHYLKELWKLREENLQLVSVNGVMVEEVLKEKKELLSYEVESWGIKSLKSMLYSTEGLAFLGYELDQGINYGYVNTYDEMVTKEIIFYQDDFVSFDEFIKYNGRDTYKLEDGQSFVHYKIDEKNNLAMLTLNDCSYNDEYKECLNKLFTEVKDKGVTNISVDLRSNGGGDSRVANEFISYLDCDTFLSPTYSLRLGPISIGSKNSIIENKKKTGLTFKGQVYILSSTNTFSSAMIFTQYISDNDLGIVIGEAPANIPSGFGEVVTFQLPNSRLKLSVSCKQFYRANPEIDDLVVEPDIKCDDKVAEEVLLDVIN